MGQKDAHLRVAAQDGRVTLTTEDLSEAAYEAEVIAEGVCFFRHKQLLPLLGGGRMISFPSTDDYVHVRSDFLQGKANRFP
jgi:hypothetical protein